MMVWTMHKSLECFFLSILSLFFFTISEAQFDYCEETNAPSWEVCYQEYSPAFAIDIRYKQTYLRPTSQYLAYAVEATSTPLISPQWEIKNVGPNYHSGFELGVWGTSFDDNDYVSITWSHFRSKDKTSRKISSSSTDLIGPLFDFASTTYKKASGRVEYHFNTIDINYGVSIWLTRCLQANLFLGLEGADVKQTLYSKFANNDDTITRTITIPASFTGAGPQFGVDTSYLIWNGFSIAGKATAAVLFGSQKTHATYKSNSPLLSIFDITPPNAQKTKNHSISQVVPAFKGSLGIAYSAFFCENIVFNLEAGYQAEVYSGALHTMDLINEVTTLPAPSTVGVFARNFHKTLSNLGLAGPYLAIDVAF